MHLSRDHYKNGGTLFGLKFQQNHGGQKLFDQAGWFNHEGAYLGHGDLSAEDLCTIARQIKSGQSFVVIRSAIWSVCRQSGMEREAPGIGYLALHASVLISSFALEFAEEASNRVPNAMKAYEDIKVQVFARKHFAATMLDGIAWH